MAFTEWLVILSAALSALAAGLAFLAYRASQRPAAGSEGLSDRLAVMHEAVQAHPRALREETAGLREEQGRQGRELREEITRLVAGFQGALAERFDRLGEAQVGAQALLREELTKSQQASAEQVAASTKSFGDFQRERLQTMEQAQKAGLERVEGELKRLIAANAEEQGKARELLAAQLDQVRKDGEVRATQMRETLTGQLDVLRKENEAKLEQMRLTVDEKLQSTLDQRLDANFKQVSERLESVQKGLGEMQTLATGVGDLKRVLTNVKARGTWGEVQLGALLEDILTPDQYARQVKVRPRSEERVDYAVRLPGQDENGQVWLPIDCKFPHEDYGRLVAAQEAADPVAVEAAGKALEKAIAAQAKTISDKYVSPPNTTDFAYLYLPTEGLFAEVIRREGFTADLRARYKVEIAGPSTLTALLNSLRVGFRSLQIQKKSSEVWTELGRVKVAFEKYGDALEAVDRKLDEAKNKVADVGKRHKQVVRSLKHVEAPELLQAQAAPLALVAPADDEDEAA